MFTRAGIISNAAILTGAPILAITSASSDNTPEFIIDVDDTVTAGDTVHLQVQASGGSWSSMVSDTTHTITSGENSANEVDLSLAPLSAGTYDARVSVHHTVDSAWSNTVTLTIAVGAASAPANVGAPVVSGTATVGSTLTTTDGTWTGTATITYTYQWNQNGAPISGATSNTYVLVTADGGTTVTCTVTGTNTAGFTSATSNGISVAMSTTTTYTYIGQASSSASGAVLTSSQNIGTASADRLVIVGTTYQIGSAVSSITVGGTALTKIIGNTNQVELWAGLVTSGSGAQSIVVTWSSGSFDTRTMAVWTAIGLTSNTVKSTGTIVTTGQNSVISVAPGDFMFAVTFTGSGSAVTWPGTSLAPTRTAAMGSGASSGASADWFIHSTNASFNVNSGTGVGVLVAATWA